jgi:hypothetical protein
LNYDKDAKTPLRHTALGLDENATWQSKGLLMSAGYCIFGTLNLHKLSLYLFYFLMYFVSFGVLAFCMSLSENGGFEAKRLKIQILRLKIQAQPCWARAHVPIAAAKDPSS